MSEFERFGGPPFVLFEYVDVEITAFNPVASHFILSVKKSFSPRYYIIFFLKNLYYLFVNVFVIASEKQVKVNVMIPIHMRYQTPQNNSLDLPVYISPPDVYIQCANLQAPSSAQSSPAGLPFVESEASINGVALTHEGDTVLTVRVPTGKLEDIQLVSWGTAIATLGATAFILFEIFWKPNHAIKKD